MNLVAGWGVNFQPVAGGQFLGGVDMSLVCCFCSEREKAGVDTEDRSLVRVVAPGPERERAEAATEGIEYRCSTRRRTGPQ